jgi:hypothetical protein
MFLFSRRNHNFLSVKPFLSGATLFRKTDQKFCQELTTLSFYVLKETVIFFNVRLYTAALCFVIPWMATFICLLFACKAVQVIPLEFSNTFLNVVFYFFSVQTERHKERLTQRGATRNKERRLNLQTKIMLLVVLNRTSNYFLVENPHLLFGVDTSKVVSLMRVIPACFSDHSRRGKGHLPLPTIRNCTYRPLPSQDAHKYLQ